MLDCAGWRFILEPKRMGRILCIGITSESVMLALSQVCQQLMVAHFGSSRFGLAGHGVNGRDFGKISYIDASGDSIRLPFPEEQFDGCIFPSFDQSCVPTSVLSAPNVSSALQWFFSELYRVLKKDAFIYLEIDNKYGYDKVWRRLLGKGAPKNGDMALGDGVFSVGALKRTARRAGFRQLRTYKLLSEEGLVREVVIRPSYEPSKNSFLVKEKIKKMILRRSSFDWFAPALAVLWFKGQPGENYLELLIFDLTRKGVLTSDSGEPFVVKRYLILPGKVILSIGQLRQLYGKYIVVLPLVESAVTRLRAEARVLLLLHLRCLNCTSLVPKSLAEDQFYGQAYFVQDEMPGTSIDAPVSSLDRVTWRAVQVLIDFHRETLEEAVLTESDFAALFSEPLHRVAKKIGAAAAQTIDNIEIVLRTELVGKPFKTVWMHGDFKVENLMIDPNSGEINGIIDWDLSRERGLPFLDLLYLLVYNRVVRGEGGVDKVFLQSIISAKWTRFEQCVLNEYCGTLNIAANSLKLLVAVFWIYHIAYRIEIRPNTNAMGEEWLRVLRACEKVITNVKAELP